MSAHNYDKLIHKTTGGGESSFKTEDIWLREGSSSGQLVIHAKSANIDQHMLKDVTFYYLYFGTNGRPTFSTRYDAKTAELFKTGHWLLTEVTENEDGQKPQAFTSVSKVTNIDWDTLRTQSQANNKPPFWKFQWPLKRPSKRVLTRRPYLAASQALSPAIFAHRYGHNCGGGISEHVARRRHAQTANHRGRAWVWRLFRR